MQNCKLICINSVGHRCQCRSSSRQWSLKGVTAVTHSKFESSDDVAYMAYTRLDRIHDSCGHTYIYIWKISPVSVFHKNRHRHKCVCKWT